MSDKTEELIDSVETISTGEILIVLRSRGKPEYQYIYREAAGVYWDNPAGGFKSSERPRQWSYSDWFFHIVSVADTCGLALVIDENTKWKEFPTEEKEKILTRLTHP